MTNPRADNAPFAVGVAVIALLALSLGDAMIKHFSWRFTLWQIFTMRSLLVLPALLVIMFELRRRGKMASPRPRAPGWIALRGLLFAAAGVIYFASLPNLPFSTAAAVVNSVPLFVICFAMLLGGERVPKTVRIAIALGFTGVLLIIRPGPAGFNFYALPVLLAAAFYALAMVVTRIRCRAENPYTLALGMHLAFIAVGAVMSGVIKAADIAEPATPAAKFLFADWRAPAMDDVLILAALGGAFAVYTVGIALAYQRAPAATIAPFEYTYLASGLLWGHLLFAERPGILALLGMSLIVAGGLTVIKHQARGRI